MVKKKRTYGLRNFSHVCEAKGADLEQKQGYKSVSVVELVATTTRDSERKKLPAPGGVESRTLHAGRQPNLGGIATLSGSVLIHGIHQGMRKTLPFVKRGYVGLFSFAARFFMNAPK